MPFLDNDGVTRLTTDYLDVFARKEDAILDPSGGLIRTDDGISVDSLIRESDGAISGSIVELTAEGHAEQFSTTGKNLLPNTATSQTVNGITFTVNADGSITANGTATNSTTFNVAVKPSFTLVSGQTYTLTGTPSGGSNNTYRMTVTDDVTVISGDYGSGITFTPTDAFVANYYKVQIVISSGYTANNLTFYPQLELGSTATEYEPYTGGAPSPSPDYPQEIQVVRGRNLIDKDNATILNAIHNGVGGIISNASSRMLVVPVEPNTTYCLSGSLVPIAAASDDVTIWQYSSLPAVGTAAISRSGLYLGTFTTTSFTTASNAEYIAMKFANTTKTDPVATLATLQLTLGSTPQPYVPYGHVGLEVRDPDTDELISCTALPLPQRGWVAGLPDGTADALHLDGAGKCEWTLPTSEYVFDGSETWGIRNSGKLVGTTVPSNVLPVEDTIQVFNAYCTHFTAGSIADTWNGNQSVSIERATQTDKIRFADGSGSMTVESWVAWLTSNPVTVLYQLATPVTEDMGYVEDWPTDIPEGATISIPELDALNVKYFVDDSAGTLARQWYERVQSEYADRITALEQAVAELATS